MRLHKGTLPVHMRRVSTVDLVGGVPCCKCYLCTYRWPVLPRYPRSCEGNRETKLEYIPRNGRILMENQLKQTDGCHTLLTFFRLF